MFFIRLTEIKIKRISKYDSFRADEHIKSVEEDIAETKNHLNTIVPYTINYFKQIKKKYGKDKERKTEIRNFDTIIATKVAVANEKLYADLKEGFIGTSLKKDEYVCECSDIDDIIVFRKDGKYTVVKVAPKVFVGKNIIHLAVFKKNDDRTIYNAIYKDGRGGHTMMKRFAVTGVTRDKEYDVTKGKDGSKILYFSVNPNGEAETIKIYLRPRPKLKKLILELDFSELAIKGRGSMGNILTRHDVHKIVMKEKGVSTLGGQHIWFDEDVFRLNPDERGKYLGEFFGEDKILVVTKSGKFRLSTFELSNHYEDDILLIEKFKAGKVFSVVYFDAAQGLFYLKRFEIEETEKSVSFIGDDSESQMIELSDDKYPRVELKFGGKHKTRLNETIDVSEFISVKSYKAKGKRLSTYEIAKVLPLDPIESEEPETEEVELLELEETVEIQEKNESNEVKEKIEPIETEKENKKEEKVKKKKSEKKVEEEEKEEVFELLETEEKPVIKEEKKKPVKKKEATIAKEKKAPAKKKKQEKKEGNHHAGETLELGVDEKNGSVKNIDDDEDEAKQMTMDW